MTLGKITDTHFKNSIEDKKDNYGSYPFCFWCKKPNDQLPKDHRSHRIH